VTQNVKPVALDRGILSHMGLVLRFANPRYRRAATVAIALVLQSRAAFAQSASPTDDSTAAPDVIVETPAQPAPLPAPARRSVWVHVDSPEPVDLGYRASDHDEFAPICTSPCDSDVPSAGTYRILPVATGDTWGPQSQTGSLRPSAEFSLRGDAPRQTIAVRPATQPGLTGGIALLIGGGAAVGLSSLWLLAAGFNDSPDATPSDTTWALVAAIAGAAAIVGGLALVILHHRSGVKVTGDPPTPPGKPQLFGAPSPMRTESLARANTALAPAAAAFPLFRVAF
jgi:hypothetical protein